MRRTRAEFMNDIIKPDAEEKQRSKKTPMHGKLILGHKGFKINRLL